MKKAFDQTVRDIKREVNKKVLKVPSVEQKVLDATSNEPWGPHGSLLADIAQASRNYHEYQMMMTLIWKRINDTGRNWRHVYKALTVLEYLVAHGSERVIDEIREHAYQISTLSDFQYIDSSGRDQGSNVRKKSQSIVVLVNDKERIQEVRQKAAVNREKYRNTSAGSMYRPSSYSSTGGNGDRYDDDRYEGRYGSRDEDRNGYGREKEWGSRDDGKYGDSYSRDGDRYSRDNEERYSRDGYRDDDYHGRSRSIDDNQYGSRGRSSDRDGDRPYEDDGQYSSRGSGAKADDHSQDGSIAGRRLDRKFSEQNLGAPPSYEEAVGDVRSPVHSERDGEASAAPAPPVNASPNQANITPAAPAAAAPLQPPAPVAANKEVDAFDEFDPRGSFPATSNGAEVDLLGSLSESFSSNALAIVPTTSATTTFDADAFPNSGSGPSFVATSSSSTTSNQPFEDPFGDGPFKAILSTGGILSQPENIAATSSFHLSTNRSSEPPQPVFQEFGDTFPGMTYVQSNASDIQLPSANTQYSHQELSTPDQDTDILADILPPSGPPHPITLQTAFPLPTGQHASQTGFPGQSGYHSSQAGFPAQTSQPVSLTGFPAQPSQASQTGFSVQSSQPSSLTGFPAQAGQPTSQTGFASFPSQMGPLAQTAFPTPGAPPAQPNANFYGSFHPQSGYVAPVGSHMSLQVPTGPTAQHNPTNFLPQSGSATPVASQVSLQIPQPRPSSPMASQPALTGSTGSLAIVPQPAKEKKFETKSSVWADTMNRGLVNLNISGPKTNPLADIGVDFDAINRRDKRMEKPTAAPVISNISMGKAMGSGSGIGRAGASALRPSSNPMMASGMGMGMGPGMGMGGGPGMGMGGYGGASQPMGGVGMRMRMNMPMNMGVGMNMGIGQGVQMQPPTGFPPGSNMPGGYNNPMMGAGGYGQPQPPYPYGGGYR